MNRSSSNARQPSQSLFSYPLPPPSITFEEDEFEGVNDEDGLDREAIYKKFGRDNPLGRELFLLYNKGKVPYKPNVSLQLRPSNPDEEHKQKHKEKNAAVRAKIHAAVSLPVKPQKPVREKKFFELGQGRKPLTKIVRETSKEFAPVPSGTLGKFACESRESQIARLQKKFENPEVKPSFAPVRPPRMTGEEIAPEAPNPTQSILNTVERGVAERREFLESMHSLGHGAKYEKQIHGEIADMYKYGRQALTEQSMSEL